MKLCNNIIFLIVYALMGIIGLVTLVGVAIYNEHNPSRSSVRGFSKGTKIKISPSDVIATVTHVKNNTLMVSYVDDYGTFRSAEIPFNRITKIK